MILILHAKLKTEINCMVRNKQIKMGKVLFGYNR